MRRANCTKLSLEGALFLIDSNELAETIKGSMDETTKAIEQVTLTAQSKAELVQKINI